MTNLVTFATARYERSRRRLLRSAEIHGGFRFWTFSERDFRSTDAYETHPRVSKTRRGAGLWLWKPYYIQKVLCQLRCGDKLAYLDSGFELLDQISPLLRLLDDGLDVACFKVHEHLNRHWTKRDCFVLMGCEGNEYLDAEQTMGGILLIKKSAFTMKFVDEWYRYNTDPRIVSDQPNTCGLPDYDGFVAHRHDQSILTNLCVRYGIPAHVDPSQFGERYRPNANARDGYKTLLNLHRERLPSWRTALKLAWSDWPRFIRGMGVHIRNLSPFRRARLAQTTTKANTESAAMRDDDRSINAKTD